MIGRAATMASSRSTLRACRVRPGIARSARARSNRCTRSSPGCPEPRGRPNRGSPQRFSRSAAGHWRRIDRRLGCGVPFGRTPIPSTSSLPAAATTTDLDGVVIHATGDLKRLRPAATPRDPLHEHPAHVGRSRRRGCEWRQRSGRPRARPRSSSISRRLEATLADHAGHGRRGVAALRHAIDAWSIDAKPADSTLEAAMARLVRRYHLPPVDVPPRDRRVGGRLPGDRLTGDPRVRRVGVPRARSHDVRAGSDPRRTTHRGRVDRRAVHVSLDHVDTRTDGAADPRHGGPMVGRPRP